MIGAMGFKYVGYVSTVPLAVLLLVVSAAPLFRRVPQMAAERQPKKT